jgi:hypothetical protein
MSGTLSPEIDADASNLLELVHDIHDITRKPALGAAPVTVSAPRTRYSPAATAVAGLFVSRSENGHFADPVLRIGDLVEETGLTADDVTDALHELRSRLKVSFDAVYAEDSLFSEFDGFWKPWNPTDDALSIAADLMNAPEISEDLGVIAARIGWPPRRLNPAITYLAERGVVQVVKVGGSKPYVGVLVAKKDAIRRFVRSRS